MAVPSAPGPLSRFAIFLLVGGLVLVLATLGVLKHLDGEAHDKNAPGNLHLPLSTGRLPATGNSPTVAATPAKPALDPAVTRLLQTISDALAVLRDPNNPNKKAALNALREALGGADPKVALAAIRGFLATGQDAATGLRFKVGEGTADAAEEARATLQANTSPDESAVAMRNLAWADPTGSKGLLASSERAMLNNAAWRQSPTGGYLEAFDVAAYAGDASLLDQLAPLGTTPSPVQRAALIAMERLSAMAPGEVVSYLNAHPDLLADRPLLRADYMGNVDLSDPAQLAQAESYLARTDVTDAEKNKFIERLAVPAGFSSDNLLTPSTIPVSLPDHAKLVNQVAGQWLSSGKYPALQPALQSTVTSTAATAGAGGTDGSP